MKVNLGMVALFATLGMLASPAVRADDQAGADMPPVAPPIESLDAALRDLMQSQIQGQAPLVDTEKPAAAISPATSDPATITGSNPSTAAIKAPVQQNVSPQKVASSTSATSLPFPMLYVYEFSASWCPSCKKLEPVVERAASKYKDFIQYIPVNVDKNEEMVRKLNVSQIPTVMIVDRSGRMLNRLIGLQQGEQIDMILEHYKQKAVASVSIPQ